MKNTYKKKEKKNRFRNAFFLYYTIVLIQFSCSSFRWPRGNHSPLKKETQLLAEHPSINRIKPEIPRLLLQL